MTEAHIDKAILRIIMMEINLLVTLNTQYLLPLKTALLSLADNNPDITCHVWLLHQSITKNELTQLSQFVTHLDWTFSAIQVDQVFGTQAIDTIHNYPQEMYFRLLAGDLLPQSVTRVIYIDPDTLIINDLTKLWQLDLGTAMMAAAAHTGLIDAVTPLNNLRLNTATKYFNTGLLLMDLSQTRKIIKAADIQQTIDRYRGQLLLPDQDVLNFLYGSHILEVPEEIWNYDTRKFTTYQLRSRGDHDLQWVMANTVVLHFSGRPKPWEQNSDGRFTALYLQYRRWTLNVIAKLAVK